MILLITDASHTGKTFLAQKLSENGADPQWEHPAHPHQQR